MATLKQRLHRKNDAGSYDTIHLETESELVLMSDGTTLEVELVKLPKTITVSDATLNEIKTGELYVSATGSIYFGLSGKIARFDPDT